MSGVEIVYGIVAALGAYGAYQQGEYQKEMGEYQSDIADINADVVTKQSEKEAQLILQQGAQEEASFRRKARIQRGTNIKNIAMSGMTMTGSPLLVMNEIAEQTELEAYGIKRSAKTAAGNTIYQGKLSALGLRQSGSEARSSGSYAYKQGVIGAGSTLMQGASKIYKSYKMNQKPKISSPSTLKPIGYWEG